MAWTIPDKGEGDNDIQSRVFQEYMEALVAGVNGVDCVLSGCAVTGGADMTPEVAKGAVLSNKTLFAIAAGTVTITTADATNPRLDLVVVTSAGALAVRTGTAAAAPKPPVRTANDVVLAVVYVPANDTAIATSQITDMRMMREHGPITIYSQVAQRVQANSTSEVSIFSNGSGLTIPNGLFLSGRQIRVTTGGNVLHNSTTAMTMRLRCYYGGTLFYDDTSVSYGTTADADRGAWSLRFNLIAAANALQRMVGQALMSAITPAPATVGIGDLGVDEIAATAPITGPTAGIAVDSDAGDRVLNITWTMSAANAAHEWTCDGILVELI